MQYVSTDSPEIKTRTLTDDSMGHFAISPLPKVSMPIIPKIAYFLMSMHRARGLQNFIQSLSTFRVVDSTCSRTPISTVTT